MRIKCTDYFSKQKTVAIFILVFKNKTKVNEMTATGEFHENLLTYFGN